MPKEEDVRSILKACQDFACNVGLESELKADLDNLVIDFVKPPNDFLGINSNPAIFINADTYRLLGSHHPTWEPNNTIAIKEEILKDDLMLLIGIITHETGHAFNVAAGIPNTETNAYMFEIEALLYFYNTHHPIMKNISEDDLLEYFDSRRSYYEKGAALNSKLEQFIILIQEETILLEVTDADSDTLSDKENRIPPHISLFVSAAFISQLNEHLAQIRQANSLFSYLPESMKSEGRVEKAMESVGLES